MLEAGNGSNATAMLAGAYPSSAVPFTLTAK